MDLIFETQLPFEQYVKKFNVRIMMFAIIVHRLKSQTNPTLWVKGVFHSDVLDEICHSQHDPTISGSSALK